MKTFDAKVEDTGQDLMCAAHGCPMKWSVQTEGINNLCSAHAWALKGNWPSVTDRLTDEIVAKQSAIKTTPRPVSDQEKQKIIASQRQLMAGAKTTQADPKAWAKRLQRKEDEGLTLSMAQRQCVRGVL